MPNRSIRNPMENRNIESQECEAARRGASRFGERLGFAPSLVKMERPRARS